MQTRTISKTKKIVPLKVVQSNYTVNNPVYNEITKVDYSKSSLSGVDRDRKLISFSPPHDLKTRSRLANMYESDPNVMRILAFFTQYVYGNKPKKRIVPLATEIPQTKSKLDDAVDKILGTRQHSKFKVFVDKVDELADIHTHARNFYESSFVYGTGMGWKTLRI